MGDCESAKEVGLGGVVGGEDKASEGAMKNGTGRGLMFTSWSLSMASRARRLAFFFCLLLSDSGESLLGEDEGLETQSCLVNDGIFGEAVVEDP